MQEFRQCRFSFRQERNAERRTVFFLYGRKYISLYYLQYRPYHAASIQGYDFVVLAEFRRAELVDPPLSIQNWRKTLAFPNRVDENIGLLTLFV